jgi:long-chain acyl-CoA synthetase
VQPKLMSAVPMLFNRVYDGVKKKIHDGPMVARVLSNYALHLARKRNELREHGKTVGSFLEWRFQLMDKIVLSKIRARICPTLKYMNSGGAAVGPQVLHFFEDIGIPICEGYGLTETCKLGLLCA